MAFLSLIARLGLNASGFEQGLRRSQSMSRRIGADISSSLKGHLAAAFGVAAITQAARKTVEYASKIDDLSKRLNVSTDALQEFDYAAKQNGGTLEQMATFLERIGLARAKILGGDQGAIAAAAAFGLSPEDFAKQRSEDLARSIGRKLNTGDIQQLLPALRELGGRSAGSLVPALQQLDELTAQFQRLGLAISPENIASLDAAADSLDRLAAQARTALAPAIAFVADGITKLIGTVSALSYAAGSIFRFVNYKDLLGGPLGNARFGRDVWKGLTTPWSKTEKTEFYKIMEQYFGPRPSKPGAPPPAFVAPEARAPAVTQQAYKQFAAGGAGAAGGLYLGADAAFLYLRDAQRESLKELRDINDNTRRLAEADADPELIFD